MGSGTVFLSARARVLQLGKHVAALMRHNATPMLMLIGACRRCSRIVFAFRQVCVRAWHVSHMVWREREGSRKRRARAHKRSRYTLSDT